jgi:hypothetical protein
MDQVKNYTAYASEVHAIRQASMFPRFYRDFGQAFQDRLRRLHIAPYRVTEVRCIEAAMFELAFRSAKRGPHSVLFARRSQPRRGRR